ncbi:MAG: hypothetical protein HY033_05940 [Ignavibacteriae bacterium]|nr:hypothetical protein [Ignavibacteria bacterium]MBI3364432.1 hypothetical protein [Ignavibacteriota bacterium]
MRRVPHWSFVVGSLFLVSLPCLSQSDSVHTALDTTITAPLPSSDSLRLAATTQLALSDTLHYRPAKKPWVAVGLSAAVPGLGQIYNENYWKTPIIIGLGGYWISEWIKLNNNYKDFRDQYTGSIAPMTPNGNDTYRNLRDFYRDERDKFAWYLGALYFLNLVDAYVGASLFDFDVGSDLGLDGRMARKATATIRLRL